MKVLILMSDNRDESGKEYNALTARINSFYAKKWKYDFLYIKVDQCFSPKGELRYPSWAKLLCAKKMMLQDAYDLIVYIDSDCIFKNQDMSIEHYLKTIRNIENEPLQQKTITFLNDIPWSDKLPCAGFFIVRGKDTALLEDWFNSDIPDFNLRHSWEQKALYNFILPKWQNDIEIINDVMFLEQEGQFLRHVGSSESNKRIPYFQSYIQKHNIE